MVVDAEEKGLQSWRRALFGEEFTEHDLLKNRIVFLDGGKDDSYPHGHYVLLGNYIAGRSFETMDALF